MKKKKAARIITTLSVTTAIYKEFKMLCFLKDLRPTRELEKMMVKYIETRKK
jgi:hypothetical protein